MSHQAKEGKAKQTRKVRQPLKGEAMCSERVRIKRETKAKTKRRE